MNLSYATKSGLALTTLAQTGDQITITAVSRLVGLSPGTLNNYPSGPSLAEPANQTKVSTPSSHRKRQQREAELVEKVTQAIALLQTNAAQVTQKAISERVQMSSANLKRYPKVKLLLHQVTGLSDSARLLALQQSQEG